jgi:hypothetical protein
VSVTESVVTFEHVRCSGPAVTLCPSVHDTRAPPAPRLAVPSSIPLRVSVEPRTSALAPSPERVTEHDVPEHETLSELDHEQPASDPSESPAASSPPTSRGARGGGEDMPAG